MSELELYQNPLSNPSERLSSNERLSSLKDIGVDKDSISIKEFEVFSRRHETQLIAQENAVYETIKDSEHIGIFSEVNSETILKAGKLVDIDPKPGFELISFADDKSSRNARLDDFLKRTESYIPSTEKSLELLPFLEDGDKVATNNKY